MNTSKKHNTQTTCKKAYIVVKSLIISKIMKKDTDILIIKYVMIF